MRLLHEQASVPALAELHEYLVKIRDEVLPKSEAGQAIAYAFKNWAALTRYCEDGDLAIDNNHTERSLRGIAVGRKNWMFRGGDRGGKTMAILRSFVGSCELAKVDPFAWFQDVPSRVGEHSIQKLDELLLFNCQLISGFFSTADKVDKLIWHSPCKGNSTTSRLQHR